MTACHRVALCVVLAVTCTVLPARAQSSAPLPLYRIVLADGSSVDAYGEWVRVGDRVVFSLALDLQRDPPLLHLSSVPADQVDFVATERYRETLRAATYAATRGDADFDQLSADIATLLAEAAETTDVARKIALAEQARTRLREWPARHYGYRNDEVKQIQALVDEVVGELRATRGDTAFDLSLVAQVMVPPVPPIAPPPTLRDTIQQALGLSRLAESRFERVRLLRAAESVTRERRLAGAPAERSEAKAVDRLLRQVAGELEREQRTDAAYQSLKTDTLESARRAASKADIKGVEKVMARARSRDEDLGNSRPEVMSQVSASLERYLETARKLRLSHDQWTARRPVLDDYADRLKPVLRTLRRARPALEDVQAFTGPSFSALSKTEGSLREADLRLRHTIAPEEVRAPHALVLSALQFAAQAMRLRRDAIQKVDMAVAREAATAAAGALSMAERARDEMTRALSRPSLP